jgi:hypothetical protein
MWDVTEEERQWCWSCMRKGITKVSQSWKVDDVINDGQKTHKAYDLNLSYAHI